ncbi:MAG: hypothetical protein A2261_00165 [Candidatus Magasanikbacteria bacterium RIFOXYA2_FULL_44_8]|uniref:Fido domain-containing protein n=1 Tax=Candidatus Magasanikbacteria bacterium RIFOXYA2_FULL_44_8 TaxID=1798696 RepID=A0A1F6NJZ0_9BACT|nr:MAG: hypothetical protein A2261_00165 [Candidatus Magasanikbacteria bacterium RIFOXYA2_FULL_44_8]
MEDKNTNLVIYTTPQKDVTIPVQIDRDTVWLSQKQMAELFQKDRKTITEHIGNVFKEGELAKNSVCRNFQHTATDGKTYDVALYNLDVIISVGYRVKSQNGTRFRIWATSVLRDHILKGFTINQNRIKQNSELKLKELEAAIKLFKTAIDKKQLNQSESDGLLRVITDYANSWVLLQKYDEGKLKLVGGSKKGNVFAFETVVEMIEQLKNDLAKKREASELFGAQRGHALQSIVGSIAQSFGGKDLYGSVEEKAANFLYLLIKDHPFSDGNKRIGSFLFIAFLAKNRCLTNKKGERKINDNALVALALLVAESDPKEKEIMIALITNLLKD